MRKFTDIQWELNGFGDLVCEHGTAIDIHCCNCHSGFLFDLDSCNCDNDNCDNKEITCQPPLC